jgi:excinuclease ABC subunit A
MPDTIPPPAPLASAPAAAPAAAAAISIRGARQNNLRNLSLDIPLNELVVVTGVSGSGKSSLVFDTLYAEGQRRYVETFSPYARQFLDRMDRPQVDAIDGVPPAIAIDQTNPVRTSRSTVGTMTELNDHLKLLYARAARLCCRGCGRPVARDTPQSIRESLLARAAAAGDPRLALTFPVTIPDSYGEAEVRALLERQGYTRIEAGGERRLTVTQDRFRASAAEPARIVESLEAALRVGQGRVDVRVLPEPAAGGDSSAPVAETVWRYSSDLHCPDCDLHYAEPTPGLYSFNSPVGACETCRGFGRVIGVDYGLVVPDESKTLREGAIRPWQTRSFDECQRDLVEYATRRGIRLDTPWRELAPAERDWVIEGEPQWKSWKRSWPGTWYGAKRFFAWLETKSYKMHVRVLLSRYRAYTPCTACGGARLKPEALDWRLGGRAEADAVLAPAQRLRPGHVRWAAAALAAIDGLTIHDLMLLPVERLRAFFGALVLPAPLDEATGLLLGEIRARLAYLCDVGLGYLTLDRQSRTLSGGEVQRINLTTALGTSLVNTLFVLDEPSIGLHPRDMARVLAVMQRLKRAGNSLVVVEHDPQLMLGADRILDLGPGPGERGGAVVYWGAPRALLAARTLTADYLAGRRSVAAAATGPAPRPRGELVVRGARAHNLKAIDVALPLGLFTCLAGVSGSGKSTLVQDVLHPALLKHLGRPTEAPGAHQRIDGAGSIADVVFVDQTPIGRTTRSNPASYVGAFDAIRALFAAAPLAKERGYTHGTFSFNSGNGRCPACGGNGFEHVEMQFLSDVYLRCPDCDGTRYRAETLEVRVDGRSIAEVLELTVSQALGAFAAHAAVVAALRPLADVGLDYLRLGQPVPTLSGGEAQRLKLAGHLAASGAAGDRRSGARARAAAPGGTLFLFDEPTTGLHFDDIARLLAAFRKLLAAGHTLLVIEHNLDVIRAADWVIELGPEGGEAGGELVAAGTPAALAAHPTSHTGRALRDYAATMASLARAAAQGADAATRLAAEEPAPGAETGGDSALRERARQAIVVHNAREHNLRELSVEIPRQRFTVVTGVSGSGKSTLAFDILFAEGQRRYLESLNAYARQFVQPAARPDVDAVYGIPPTVAIEQRTSRGGRKSTVATMTELYHFLRLLYMKLGTQYCPACDVPIEPQSFDAIVAQIVRDYRGRRVGLLAPLVVNRKGYYTELAAWARNKGHTHLRVDGEFLPVRPWPRLDRFREHSIELPVADVAVLPGHEGLLRAGLAAALEHGKGVVQVLSDLDDLDRAMRRGERRVSLAERVFSIRRACPGCGTSFPEPDPRLFSFNSKHGWCPGCLGTGVEVSGYRTGADASREDEDRRLDAWLDERAGAGALAPCPACHGERLNPVARNVRLHGRSISQATALPVGALGEWLAGLAPGAREREIARDARAEIGSRLAFLAEVGLGYLTLDRAAPTLSGGEAQRIRLAAQLGSNLQGVCYVLDEPTIGLHPRDNRVLLDTLQKLARKGNTLVVVEHDEDTIRRADHVIDLGPGAGTHGGRVVAAGSADRLCAAPESVTGRFLAAPLLHPLAARRPVGRDTPSLAIRGATLHNLKRAEARVPLARLTLVTGVSGSGKSTLARDLLLANLSAALAARRERRKPSWSGLAALEGVERVGRVLEVDQTPIGKTPRSCPATYIGFWDAIRRLYADTSEARMRGYAPARFSFNTGDGRCPVCEGQGVQRVEMSFLPDVKLPCDACGGRRYTPQTLSVRFKGASIGEVLAMSVEQALAFFAAHPAIRHPLELLADVGLGYLTLGQPSPTLSGGEAQRIKLVTELARARAADGAELRDAARRPGRGAAEAHTVYVLDEPTVGLHMADVEKLIRVLHRLVDAGHTVLVVEHNLDLMAEADWIIDLGPEGGDGGGRVVAQGPPEAIARAAERSHTGRILAPFLIERAAPGR